MGRQRASIGRLSCQVYLDFDGTIAPVDTTDLILERFADPSWLRLEDELNTGKIGSRECLIRQVDLMRATPEALDDFISRIDIDPGVPDFVDLCRHEAIRVTVVSDGFDRTIDTVLARAGLSLPRFANALVHAGDDRWRLKFPNARSSCRKLAGTCKCGVSDAATGQVRIVVGDGRSDFCIAEQADLVLAKGPLARHCRDEDIPHFPFTRFEEATELLAGWLDDFDAVAGSAGAHRDE